MEKKAISIIALDPRAARSYGRDVEGLFGEVADVSVFSVMDGSAMGVLPHADLFAASTDAFGSPEELARHVPIDSQTMAVQASFRWQELRRLKELPAGSRVLFVNMTETMAREAIAQLEQFGITHVHWIPFYPCWGRRNSRPISNRLQPAITALTRCSPAPSGSRANSIF